MKNTITKIIATVCLVSVLLLTFTGCGGFFAEEELIINSVTHNRLEDGSVQLVITYKDDVKEPDVFVLNQGPQGEVGQTGKGIESVVPVHDDERNLTVVTITYSDGDVYAFEIPDSATIEHVGYVKDEVSGQLFFEVVYTTTDSNGVITERYPIDIPENGKDGKDGAKIVGAECIQINEDFSAVWEFVMSDGSTFEVTVPTAPGVLNVECVPDPEHNGDYKMTIIYTTLDEEGNNVTQTFWIDRPNQWTHDSFGSDGPSAFTGKIGDYAFDDTLKIIWHKEYLENGEVAWVQIANLKVDYSDVTKYRVTFHFDDAEDENETTVVRHIRENSNFYYSGYSIPTPPEKEGYVFAGWYTERGLTSAPVTMGAFTNLTVVMGTTDLYPLWIAE